MGAFDGIATFAGGAQDSLENLILRKMREADQRHRFATDAAHLQIEKQRADDEGAYHRESLASMEDQRQATAALRAQQGASKIASALAPGSLVNPDTKAALEAGDLGNLIQHKDATLASRNITGRLMPMGPKAAPSVGQLASTANPGQDAKDIYTGTADQLQAAEDRKSRAAELEAARAEREAARNQSAADKAELVKLTASLRPAPQAPLVMVQTVDENGNPVSKFVKKEDGASYAKPANATTATRVSSAETVNQVGNDIISKLSDPKYAAVVGPAMGRASKLGDLIGNPPPEFAELAGQIESYALANMGVHGMRSAQGAEAIKKLLEQHHTPESLIATIRGLNDFSTRFVAGNKPKAGGGATAASGAAKDPLGIR